MTKEIQRPVSLGLHETCRVFFCCLANLYPWSLSITTSSFFDANFCWVILRKELTCGTKTCSSRTLAMAVTTEINKISFHTQPLFAGFPADRWISLPPVLFEGQQANSSLMVHAHMFSRVACEAEHVHHTLLNLSLLRQITGGSRAASNGDHSFRFLKADKARWRHPFQQTI